MLWTVTVLHACHRLLLLPCAIISDMFFPHPPHSLPFWAPVFRVVRWCLRADFMKPAQLFWFMCLVLCFYFRRSSSCSTIKTRQHRETALSRWLYTAVRIWLALDRFQYIQNSARVLAHIKGTPCPLNSANLFNRAEACQTRFSPQSVDGTVSTSCGQSVLGLHERWSYYYPPKGGFCFWLSLLVSLFVC